MKTLKKLDIVIIISMVIISFIPYFIFSKMLKKEYSSTYANIKLDGKIYDNIPLSSFKGEKEIRIDSEDGSDYNIIKIKDNQINIEDASCKDSLCIKQGSISKVGQTIVCLPHKLIIEIKGEESNSSSDEDDIILSH